VGWFHSSLLVATGNQAQSSRTKGVVHPRLDAGRKGASPIVENLWANALYPNEIVEPLGADLLRLWGGVCRVSSRCEDERGGVMTQLQRGLSQNSQHVFGFALGNLADFDPSRDQSP